MGNWTLDDMPDQSGRTAIVTGANTGIGFETARALALHGAQVTLACRSPDKGRKALERILAEVPEGSAVLEQLDLADLADVRAFADRFKEQHDALDLLILNAGVMVPPSSKTKQGFELQFGVNHLAHFALTGALLPLLQGTAEARVVVVSSTGAQFGKMDFDDLDFEKRGYKRWPAYGQSKLANQLFTREMQRRLEMAGSSLQVNAAHPGWTATDLQRSAWYMRMLNHVFGMQPSQGALPTLRAATDPSAKGAEYFGPHGLNEWQGYPVLVDMQARAMNDDDAARLWEVSEELTGVQFGLPSG